MPDIKKLEEVLNYEFKNKKLIITALTHSSYANEHRSKSYERLEFLGDSVLSIIISDYIFDAMKNNDEGDLSRIRASLVCEEALAEIARKIGLFDYIYLGNGEERAGSRNRDSILSDVFESTLAAVYLDGGMDVCKKIVLNVMADKLNNSLIIRTSKDFKSRLQEAIQQKYHGKAKICYKTVNESGPEHNKTFEIQLIINDKEISTGKGNTKKEAEQEAASKALSVLKL